MLCRIPSSADDDTSVSCEDLGCDLGVNGDDRSVEGSLQMLGAGRTTRNCSGGDDGVSRAPLPRIICDPLIPAACDAVDARSLGSLGVPPPDDILNGF